MASSLRILSITLGLFAWLVCVKAFNNTNSTGTHHVTAVVLDNETAFGVCVYPRSGTYSFLARLLYYCTLIFALFSSAHLWLVAGALTSALVYSGAAAVHACLLVWRGPNPYIENDSWALYAILNTACLVTVPLLNWSGTLRRLGQKAASLKDPKALKTNSDVGTRTIVMYWAFLVLIGFLCIWEQMQEGAGDNNMEYPDMSKVVCSPGTNASMEMSPNGTFHRRAIDNNFIQDNGCTDPCNQITTLPAIFRNQNELVLLPHSQALLWNATLPGAKYAMAEHLMTIENANLWINLWTLPFILVQGFITALFGRRDPREIRDLLYITLYMEHPKRPIFQKPYLRRTQEIVVRIFAGLNYLIACAVVIFCIPFFLITVVSQEFSMWDEQPDSEKPYMVGQWSPWVYAALVILAAFIGRYHDSVIHSVTKGCRNAIKSCFPSSKHLKEPDLEPNLEHGNNGSTSPPPPPHLPEKSWISTSTSIANSRTTTSPSPPPPRQPLTIRLLNSLESIWKTTCHPLNQSGKGPIDEIRNFYRWCGNPAEVSRLAVRFPIRGREARYIDAPVDAVVVDAGKGDARAGGRERGLFGGAV
ncbi:hypothetical protein JMJ35_008527 [Cladonia borealis]|uniref:Uncharacterized protein n=1 Tax=Cladonia borealis TaxID=184061 RepID=A0AA39U6Z4_9LECA|nr:hypothetical protein JMJ35_008527 [Cladonia borealis]